MSTSQRDVGGSLDAQHDLNEVLSRVARRLQEDHGDVEATLRAITAAIISAVPHAEDCGISYVIGRKRVEPRAASSRRAHQADELQGRLGQGPCLDAVWEQEVVRVDDVSAATDRWPEFAREAAALGIGSMLCFQLFVEGDQLGALNLYAGRPGAFAAEDEEIGHMVAVHAAVALAGAEHEQNLRRGLDSRDLIGQAKGILMERHKLTAHQAFGVLAQVSQETNRKLVDLAHEVTETGTVPDPSPGRH